MGAGGLAAAVVAGGGGGAAVVAGGGGWAWAAVSGGGGGTAESLSSRGLFTVGIGAAAFSPLPGDAISQTAPPTTIAAAAATPMKSPALDFLGKPGSRSTDTGLARADAGGDTLKFGAAGRRVMGAALCAVWGRVCAATGAAT